MTGGGGGVATIFVSYPYSSTLTCTNGSVTLTATNSTTSRANAHFNIPATGNWTLTAKSGSFSASETVTVSVGGSYFVELYYKSYLIENGIIKVTPVFNDSSNIKQNVDPNGVDCYDWYCAPKHIWMFNTIGWAGHHALVMFPVTITYATRLVYESGSEYSPRGGGGTPTSTLVEHTDRGFTPNYTTNSSHGTNKQMAIYYNGGIWSEGLNMIGQFIYTDLKGYSGSGYATIGWESSNTGAFTRVEVKNFYVEY